ncbi:MAG: aminotransferase class I/II-fold pyridoxal phosphate-dependent enzyme, partial [Pseudomonadota bacterium]
MDEGKRRPSDAARALAATIQRQALSPPPVQQAAPPEPPPQENAPATSFAALPSLRMLAMQGEALAGHGLSPPFFRAQSTGTAGMTAMIDEAPRLSFASYDYLGLNRHPAVRAAATKAIAAEGLSAGASRLVGGERPVHRMLEQALAAHYGTEDALCLVSGHATNVTLLGTLLGNEDMVILDAY